MCRYVWGHRNTLARSVHDMLQQAFSPKHTELAFKSMRDWLYEGDEIDHTDKLTRLSSFKKDDTEVFQLAAVGLWNMATGSNQPWGRSYTNPTYYLHLDCREKVRNGHVISRIGFFFVFGFFF